MNARSDEPPPTQGITHDKKKAWPGRMCSGDEEAESSICKLTAR